MEKILVIAIVASAGLYLFFRLKKALKGGGCCGDCGGCSMSQKCTEIEKNQIEEKPEKDSSK